MYVCMYVCMYVFSFCLNAKTRKKVVVNVLSEVLLVGLRMSLV